MTRFVDTACLISGANQLLGLPYSCLLGPKSTELPFSKLLILLQVVVGKGAGRRFVISRSGVQVPALAPVESIVYGFPIFPSSSKTASICRLFADAVSRTAVETRRVPGTQCA